MRCVNVAPAIYVDLAKELSPAEFAIEDMAAFDRLGPLAREALARSRFGGSAADIERRWGGPFADDEAVARAIGREDGKFSGCFGPRADSAI